MPKNLNRYQALIQKIFFDRYRDGSTEFEFAREALEEGAAELGFARVKNLGDVPYSFRYRNDLPDVWDKPINRGVAPALPSTPPAMPATSSPP